MEREDNIIKDSVRLPINIQYDFNVLLNFAFPLCILLSNPKYKGWYYENYIRIFTQLNGMNHFECGLIDSMDYSIGGNIETRLLRTSYISSDILTQVKDICTVLKNNIKKKNYSVIFLDEYYLDFAPAKNRWHFAHEVLIYGYDDIQNHYLAVAYKDKKLQGIEIDYNDLQNAYNSAFKYIEARGGWETKMLIMFQLLDVEDMYPFSISEFRNALNEYKKGQYKKKDEFLSLITERNNIIPEHKVKYGSKSLEDFQFYLEENYKTIKQTNEEIDFKEVLTQYNAFHMLRDHKKGLYDRLNFIADNYIKKQEMIILVSDYSLIMEKSERLRLLHMKATTIGNIGNKDNLLNIIQRMISIVKDIIQMEGSIINNVIDLLDKECTDE